MKRTDDPAFRILRARLGAYAQLAKYDSRETTRAAREAFNARFVDEVDPDRVLPEGERARRADAARRAHFTRLALKRQQSTRRLTKTPALPSQDTAGARGSDDGRTRPAS